MTGVNCLCDRQKFQSILNWLLSDEMVDKQFTPHEIAKVNERLNYRYRILCQRYLYTSSHQSYHHLIVAKTGQAA